MSATGTNDIRWQKGTSINNTMRCDYTLKFELPSGQTCRNRALQGSSKCVFHTKNKPPELRDFKGRDLTNFDLREADLCGCDLSNAILTDMSLKGANLRDANLQNADLRRCDLVDCIFDRADMAGCDLSGARFVLKDLIKGKIDRAIYREPSKRPPHCLPDGYIFDDKFEILEHIGDGSFGFVYRVRKLRTSSIYALKILNPQWNQNVNLMRRFKRQQYVITKIDHPNVVKIYEVDQGEGCYYLLMEYLEGRPLSLLIQRKESLDKISFEGKLGIFHQSVLALEALSKNKILHRDIKPSNIFILDDLRVKLLDFELAKHLDLSGITSQQAPGTVKYWSPEHWDSGRLYSEKSDIYSLGLSMYELFTGSFPVEKEDRQCPYRWSSQSTEPISPREIDSCIPQEISEILIKCITKEKGRRYTKTSVLLDDLARFIDKNKPNKKPEPKKKISIIPKVTKPLQELILVKGGTFRPMSTVKDERGVDRIIVVELKSFYMDKYPVTNEEYYRFLTSTGMKPPKHWKDGIYPMELKHHPVVYVSYHQAKAYAQWAGKRLPSEFEWELAASGYQRYSYPWGNNFDRQYLNCDHVIGSTSEVKRFPKGQSPFGCYDMCGNVWEWTDTHGIFFRNYRIVKGGSWKEKPDEVSIAIRFEVSPRTQTDFIGFRCVRDI